MWDYALLPDRSPAARSWRSPGQRDRGAGRPPKSPVGRHAAGRERGRSGSPRVLPRRPDPGHGRRQRERQLLGRPDPVRRAHASVPRQLSGGCREPRREALGRPDEGRQQSESSVEVRDIATGERAVLARGSDTGRAASSSAPTAGRSPRWAVASPSPLSGYGPHARERNCSARTWTVTLRRSPSRPRAVCWRPGPRTGRWSCGTLAMAPRSDRPSRWQPARSIRSRSRRTAAYLWRARADQTATLLDLRARKRLGNPFSIEQGSIPVARFTPGSDLVIDNLTDTAQWPTDVRRWRAFACQVAGRDLTRAEWNDLLPDRPYQSICPQ